MERFDILNLVPARENLFRIDGGEPAASAESNEAVRAVRRKSPVTLNYDSAIVKFASDALIVLSCDGVVRTWNPGATRLFGFTAAETIGQSIAMITSPDQADAQLRLLREASAGESGSSIETTRCRRDGSLVDIEFTVMPIRDVAGTVIALATSARDITARRAVESHRDLVAEELNHRIKNTLTTVQSIATQSLRGATSLDSFGAIFAARLRSFSTTHTLLTRNAGRGAGLSDLIEAELAPYGNAAANRWSTSGPHVILDSRQAVAFGMMLHELATNAAKYGAFSALTGHVATAWHMIEAGAARRLIVTWVESGGPAVVAPTRRGFGTRLISAGLAFELDGDVILTFDPAGVRCLVDVPFGEPVPVP